MTYSCSLYFSDQFSYKILFIWSYGLRDMNFPSYNTRYAKQSKRETNGQGSTGPDLADAATARGWERTIATAAPKKEDLGRGPMVALDLVEGVREQKQMA
jgi:hypothetical protein